MGAEEVRNFEVSGARADSTLQTTSNDVAARATDRRYGSILTLAMVCGELAWLCALAYIAYRLIS